MIPKIIHQTWKTKELPDKLKKWHQQIIELHPGWEIKLWTDKDNLNLVKERFPQLVNNYMALEYNIMRVDMIRYMYMMEFGGYYLDLDFEVFVPFDNQTSQPDLMLPISWEDNGKVILGNCLFASIPQHPFWKDILEDFQNNPPLKKIYNKFDILKLTGPAFISNIYFKAPEKYKGFLVPKNVYHPDDRSITKKNHQKAFERSGTRGIHHCKGSWIKGISLINIISRADASIKRRFKKLTKPKQYSNP